MTTNVSKSLQRAVTERGGKISRRGQLSRDEVEERAKRLFQEEFAGLNNWDRRRIISRIEKLSRYFPQA